MRQNFNRILNKHVKSQFLRKLISNFVYNFSGNGVVMIAGLLAGFFYAKFLGPEQYGIWKTALMLSKYSAFLTLGIPFVIRRDFVQLKGEGKIEESLHMAYNAFSYSLITTVVAFLGYLIIGIFFIDNTLLSVAIYSVALLQIVNFFYKYSQMVNEGYLNYKLIAKAEFIKSITQIISLPLVYFFGFYALLIVYLFMHALPSIFFYFNHPIKVKWELDISLLKKMLSVGVPLYLGSVVTVLFSTIDRLLIADMLSFESVGLYSLGALIISPLVVLLKSLSSVLFTRLNDQNGLSKSSKTIKKHIIKPQLFFSYTLPPVIGIGIIALPLIVNMLLPEYNDGIIAAQINVFAVYSMTIALFANNALFIAGKQKIITLSLVLAGVIKISGSYLVLKLGYGIEFVALVSLISYFFRDSFMFLFIAKEINYSLSKMLNFFFEKNLPLLVLLLTTFFIIKYENILTDLAGINNVFVTIILQELIVILVSIPFLIRGRQILKQVMKSSLK